MKTLISGEKLSPVGRQIEQFLKYIGLDTEEASIMENNLTDMSVSFSVVYRIPINLVQSTSEIVDQYISHLRDRLRKSEEVTRMVMDVQKENERLIAENSRLTLEVEELTPLRNHYEVEMKLRHGEVLIGLDGVQVKSGLR